nr:ComEC/Rec2 family competence protein [Paenibacillus sp. MMS18-CY102]
MDVYLIVGAGLALLFAAARLAQRTGSKLALICLGAYLIGGAWAHYSDSRKVTELPGLVAAAEGSYPPVTYDVKADGTIISPVEIDGDSVRFRIRAGQLRISGEKTPRELQERLLVQLKLLKPSELQQARRWQRGDHIAIHGQLELPPGPANEGGFDYRNYLHSISHIDWLLRTKGTEQAVVEPNGHITVDTLLGRIDQARRRLGSLMDALYGDKQTGYMKGLVLGIIDGLDPDVFRQFSELGLTHVLAISGMHVAVFLAIIHMFLRLLRLTRERSLLVLAWATPVYVLLSGASPSVIRAGTMAVIGLLAARANRLKDGLHLLAASAVIMLAWNPAYVRDIGFQLSFLVTAGLIIGVAPVRALLPQWRLGKMFLDAIAVTFVAQIVSFPVSIYYFNQWNPLSLPANLVLVPFISFIVMPLGAASLVAQPVWPVAGHWLATVTEALNTLTFTLVEHTAALRGWQTIWAKPPVWWVAAWYTVLAIGIAAARLLARSQKSGAKAVDLAVSDDATMPLAEGLVKAVRIVRQRYWMALLSAMAAIAVLLSFAWLPDLFQRTASLSVLDVGQGDAILIRTGEGKHILIDGGGTVDLRKPEDQWRVRNDPFEVGRKVLVPLLKQRGIHSLDIVVITHLDKDHIGGLQAVLESLPVQAILWNGTSNSSPDAQKLLQTALRLHIPMYPAAAGMSWRLGGGTRMDVLWPDASGTALTGAAEANRAPGELVGPVRSLAGLPNVEDQNERSVALLLTMYGRTFLLPGDAGKSSEAAILERLRIPCNAVLAGLRAGPQQSNNHCLDVLKAGHHGSKNSSLPAWLAYWRPAFAVVSAGKDNLYHHPHPETLARLAAAHTGVWRTDRDGETRFAVAPNGTMFISWSRDKWMDNL